MREHALTQTDCTVCGARLDPGADWCSQCYAATTEVVRPGMLDVPPPAPVVRAPSRLRAGATTFGPRGRIAITAGVVGVAILGTVVFLFPYRAARSQVALAYPVVFLVPYSTFAWLVLRDVWKRAWQPIEVLQARPHAADSPGAERREAQE